MNEKIVIKIIIKTRSGYVPDEEAYEDEMILDRKSIHYRIKPSFRSLITQSRDWTFITSNMEYEMMFESLSDYVISVLNHKDAYFGISDEGSISFSVIYDDNTSDFFEFECSPTDFYEGLSWIRGYVPPKEDVPEMLKTWEDYCAEKEMIILQEGQHELILEGTDYQENQ